MNTLPHPTRGGQIVAKGMKTKDFDPERGGLNSSATPKLRPTKKWITKSICFIDLGSKPRKDICHMA